MADLKIPYEPKGFPDEDEELRIIKLACLDAFGQCGEEVPAALLKGLRYQRSAVVGRVHYTRMAATAARVREAERLSSSLSSRVSELERKRAASGIQITKLHKKLAKLKVIAGKARSRGADAS